MLLALQAGANGLPFTPVRGLLNSDYMKIRPDFKVITDPYSGDDYVVVPSIVPDVAVIHAFAGARSGAVVTDSFRNDRLLATAAKQTIAVVEEIVDEDEVVAGRFGVYVSAVHIDAVVCAPHGAHPTSCRERYGPDLAHLGEYMEASKTDEAFEAYLKKYIIEPKNHDEYMRIAGAGGVR